MQKFELERAVREHSRSMFAYACALLGDWHEAEDAVQEAFVSAWLNRENYRGGKLSAWLLSITRRKCLDRLRRTEPLPLAELPERAGPDPAESAPILDALDCLSREDRAIVLWRLIEGQDYAEIAERLGINEAAARKRYERAKKRLAGELRAHGFNG